tara:strand:+ start:8602 stop:9267 length:666 start_codon:yes stop_codon:yes gene_type:complete
MDLDLPSLEMIDPEDFENEPTIDDIEADIEASLEESDPFIKQPTADLMRKMAKEQEAPVLKKKKRELTQKQLDHLSVCREKAKEKREAKKKAKDEALAEVNEKHKSKSYRPAQHRAKVEREYKKKTLVLKEDLAPIEEEKETPEDFVPTHKAKEAKVVEEKKVSEEMAFINFMSNMEKYKVLKIKNAPASNADSIPKKVIANEAAPVPLQVPVNPYNGFFG